MSMIGLYLRHLNRMMVNFVHGHLMNQTIDCYFCCYRKQVTMATEGFFYISAV